MTDRRDLVIRLTNEAQEKQYISAAYEYEPWAQAHGQTFEQFCERLEREFREGAWIQNGRGLSWALVRRSDYDGEMLAACETHRTRALVKRQGQDVESAWFYGVTSVIAPKKHRGKKYAMVMLQQLHYLLAPEGALPAYPDERGQPPTLSPEERLLVPPAVCSLLSSDIGPAFYEKCTIGLDKPGWVADSDNQHQVEWSINPIARESLPSPSDPPAGGGWALLYDRDMQALTSDLSILAKASLRDAQPSLPIALQQDPASEGLLDFMHRRSTFGPQPEWRDTSHPDWPANEPRAVKKRNPDGTETIVVFTISNYELAPETFLITYIHNLLPSDVSSLLDKLDEVCAGTGLKKGLVWDIAHDSILGKAWTEVEGRKVECSQRAGIDGHLLALAWYTPTGQGEFVDRQMYNWL